MLRRSKDIESSGVMSPVGRTFEATRKETLKRRLAHNQVLAKISSSSSIDEVQFYVWASRKRSG